VYVEIDLGKPRKLRYDFNAIADIEARAGVSIGVLCAPERSGYHTTRLLLWGGLRWYDKGITLERAGSMIGAYLLSGGDLADVMEKVLDALVKSGFVKIESVDGDDEDDEGNLEAETVN
jgi:hypothetical protein